MCSNCLIWIKDKSISNKIIQHDWYKMGGISRKIISMKTNEVDRNGKGGEQENSINVLIA